jgi:hypothetical protein
MTIAPVSLRCQDISDLSLIMGYDNSLPDITEQPIRSFVDLTQE